MHFYLIDPLNKYHNKTITTTTNSTIKSSLKKTSLFTAIAQNHYSNRVHVLSLSLSQLFFQLKLTQHKWVNNVVQTDYIRRWHCLNKKKQSSSSSSALTCNIYESNVDMVNKISCVYVFVCCKNFFSIQKHTHTHNRDRLKFMAPELESIASDVKWCS